VGPAEAVGPAEGAETTSGQLPFTGLNLLTLLVLGLAFFALGTALRAGQRVLGRQ
jgi:hypothetical protein